MTAAHDQAGRRNDAVGALAARQLRIFLEAVERNLGGAAEHREHRAIFHEVDGVIAPFAGGDLAAIKIENAIELAAAECDVLGGGWATCRGSAPEGLARIDIAGTERHAAPPFPRPMIAPGAAHRKGFL